YFETQEAVVNGKGPDPELIPGVKDLKGQTVETAHQAPAAAANDLPRLCRLGLREITLRRGHGGQIDRKRPGGIPRNSQQARGFVIELHSDSPRGKSGQPA